MANPVTDLLEHINHQVSQLSTASLSRVTEVLDAAEVELTHALASWSDLGLGSARFTPQMYRNSLVQIRGALTHIRGDLAEGVNSALRHGGVLASHLATSHLITEVTQFSTMFEGSVRPIAIEAATVLADGKALVFKRFSNSAKRYAGQVGEDIRKQLAIGVVRGENIDQLTNRLVRLGGPKGLVYTQGQPGSIRAKAEMISEGLFRRYRHYAERLAVTETVNAYNEFAMVGMQELEHEDPGYFKRWDAAIDRRTCELCGEYDDVVVKLEENFPRGVAHPPLHPRCRCAQVVWRKEWDESNHKDDLISETIKGKEPKGVVSVPHRIDLPKQKASAPKDVKPKTGKIVKELPKLDLKIEEGNLKTSLGILDKQGQALEAHGWVRNPTTNGEYTSQYKLLRNGKVDYEHMDTSPKYKTKEQAEEWLKEKVKTEQIKAMKIGKLAPVIETAPITGPKDLTHMSMKDFEKWYDKHGTVLTDAEKAASAHYGGNGYSRMNRHLRDPKNGLEGVRPIQKEELAHIAELDKVIAKEKASTDMLVYRGSKTDITSGLKSGDILHDKAYLSTSVDEKAAREGFTTSKGNIFHIEVPKGHTIAPVNTGLPEGELLLPRGSKLQIISIEVEKDTGIKIVRARVIPNEKA